MHSVTNMLLDCLRAWFVDCFLFGFIFISSNIMTASVKSPIAALFKYELQYLLDLYFELEDNYNISFAHIYFHSFDAWNAEELAATDYFKMLKFDLKK